MAVAVASSASAVGNEGTSTTVTAPTSIAEGDLLLIVAAHGFDSTVSSTGFTEAFSQYVDSGSGYQGTFTVLYKHAVSADESAVNYTVSVTDGANIGAVVMFRITGTITAGNPITAFDTGSGYVLTSGGLTVSEAVDIDRPTAGLQIIVATAWTDDNFTGEITNAGYTVTSGAANPTWTEVSEQVFEFATSLSRYGRLAVAYSTDTNTSDITNYGFTYDVSSLDKNAFAIYGLIYIPTPANASGSNTLVTTTTATFDATGATNVSASNDLATATAAALAQSGVATSPSSWTNPDKPSTTWTNTPK